MSDEVVLFDELPSADGGRIGVATLNSEKTLNSLSLEMIERLNPQLDIWQHDNAIDAVVLRGVGSRAFCAGGDIQALYASMTEDAMLALADRFFLEEYKLDYRLHTFPKPVVCLGTGIVMGGGLGLFSASTVRLVGPRSRIAMPELTIGLFPDAGASWILKNLPYHLAAFLAMTGVQISGADALSIGLATHAVGDAVSDTRALQSRLSSIHWTDPGALDELDQTSAIEAHDAQLREALGDSPLSAEEIVNRIDSLAGQDEWLDRAIATMHRGCPTTLAIIARQLACVRDPDMALAESFRMEHSIASHCLRNPDFREGVRALIIDKDMAPDWRYKTLAETPEDYVLSHFKTPFAHHPLKELVSCPINKCGSE